MKLLMSSSRERHRNILFIFSFFTIALAAGLVYGWPALRRNLVKNEGTALTENQLGVIFTVGSWSTQGGRFFFGIARDRYFGTRMTACFCLTATAAGCIGIAFCDENNMAGLATSLFLVGLGSGAQLCLQPVASLFPSNYQGSILASFSGSFQVAGLIFVMLTAITANRRKSFGPFALFLGLLALLAYKLLPRNQFYFTEVEANEGEDEDVNNQVNDDVDDAGNEKDQENQTLTNDQGENDDGNTTIKHGDEAQEEDCSASADSSKNDDKGVHVWDQMKSIEYVLLVLWFSVQLIPLQYYVATIGFQLERKGDDDGTYTRLFSVLYASAAAFAPILGKIADALGLGPAQATATILSSFSLLFLTFESVSLEAQVAGMTSYGLGRMMVFSMFFTNVGKRFGYGNYGTLAGLGLILSAIASLLQYPLITIAAGGSEDPVNLYCALWMVGLGLPYNYWLWRREKKYSSAGEAMVQT